MIVNANKVNNNLSVAANHGSSGQAQTPVQTPVQAPVQAQTPVQAQIQVQVQAQKQVKAQKQEKVSESIRDDAHKPKPEPNLDEKQWIQAMEKTNKAIEGTTCSFEYSVHEQTKQIMVKVIDRETKEVIPATSHIFATISSIFSGGNSRITSLVSLSITLTMICLVCS